mgnify:CR=1 FL=1
MNVFDNFSNITSNNININRNNITITSSIIIALSLLLKKPESFIPYMVFDATIIDDIPLLAMKYPTPNVIKNVGVILVAVIIGARTEVISSSNILDKKD